MHRAIALGRTVGNVMAGLVMSGASVADAAVDMTATWRIQATAPGPISIVTYETMVQTGTTLVMSRPVDPPVAFPGTIDPDTGVFQFSFGPAMQSGVEEPGPEVLRQGVVAPDGLTYTAQQSLCIWDWEWACLTFPVIGTRTAFTCGNGVVEGAEQCDFGAENGGDCCTAVCAWLDPDDDDVCAAVDNCPDHRNPAQEDWDHDGLGNPCDETPQGPPSDELRLGGISIAAGDPAGPVAKLAVTGDTTGPLGVPTALRLTDAGGKILDLSALPSWATKDCDASPTRVRCRTTDKTLKMTLAARRSDPTALRMRLAVKDPPIVPPFVAPVGFTVGLADGVHIGLLSSCKPTARGGIRCKR